LGVCRKDKEGKEKVKLATAKTIVWKTLGRAVKTGGESGV